MKYSHSLLCSLIGCLCSLVPLMQTIAQSTISGMVKDHSTKDPLIGANVVWKSKVWQGSRTEQDGSFVVSTAGILCPDTLLISYLGYQPIKVAIDSFMANNLELDLFPSVEGFDNLTIEVKAPKLLAREFSVAKLNQLDIYTNPNAKADALLAVQSLASTTSIDESANVSFRGSSPAHTHIYLDGVPIRHAVRLDQSNGIGQFSIFNTALLNSVDVYASNAPLMMGASTSGAIALETTTTTGQLLHSISANLASGGYFGQYALSKKLDLTAYGNYNFGNGLRWLNPRSMHAIRGLEALDGGILLHYHPSTNHRIKWYGYGLSEQYRYGITLPTWSGDFNQIKQSAMSIGTYEWQKDHWKMAIRHGLQWHHGDYQLANIHQDILNIDVFQSFQASYYKNKIQFMVGGHYWFNERNADMLLPVFNHAVGEEYPNTPFMVNQSIKMGEGFVYGKRTINDQLTIGIGGRWHYTIDDSDPIDWSAQLNIHHAWEEGHQIIFGGGRYFAWILPQFEFNVLTKVQSRQLGIDYQYKGDAWNVHLASYYKVLHWDDVQKHYWWP